MNQAHDESKPRAVWCCAECGIARPDEDAAIECCMPPAPGQWWQCCCCDHVHGDYEDARLCCYDEHGKPLPPSAAELEARGQMRLSAIV